MNVVTCLREFAQFLTRYALNFRLGFLTTHPNLVTCEKIDVSMKTNTHIYVSQREQFLELISMFLGMISWMECYYLDARTSDTICSYQVQTPQIETHNTQDWSHGLYWGLGCLDNKEGVWKNKGSLSNSEQSNELDI